MISNGVCGYAKKPRRERCAAPLEFANVQKSLMKDLRRELFRGRAFAHSPRDVGIRSLEVKFIQLGKTARVLLCRFDQEPLVLLVFATVQD